MSGKIVDSRHGLTDREAQFVVEYLIDLNAAQACTRAGYKSIKSNVTGDRLLRLPRIHDAIKDELNARAARTLVTADKVVREYARLAFANMQDYISVGDDGSATIDLSQLTRDKAAAISEVTIDEIMERSGDVNAKGRPTWQKIKRIKFKLGDKKGALDSLAKHLHMMVDRVEVSGKIDIAEEKKVEDIEAEIKAILGKYQVVEHDGTADTEGVSIEQR